MTRRIVRISRAASHPGVAVVFDARTQERLDQVALSRVEAILDHRSSAYFYAQVETGCIRLYDEIPAEEVEHLL